MRFLLMVMNNLTFFIKKRTSIFLTLFLGLTICFFAFIYLHTDNLANYKQRDKSFSTLLNYKMSFNSSDVRSVTAFVDEIIGSRNLPGIKRLYTHTYVKDGNYILSGFYGQSVQYIIEAGKDFKDASAVRNPVLLANCLLNPNQLMNIEDARFKIMGREYKVIGTGFFEVFDRVKDAPFPESLERNAIIPYENFKEIAGDCSLVDIYFERPLDEQETDFLKAEFSKRFPNEELKVPIPGEKKYSQEIYLTLLIIALGIGLSMVNVIAMFRYWIDCNLKRYYTYMLCGATGLRIYALIIAELLFVSATSFLLGLLAYYTVIPKLQAYGFLYFGLDFINAMVLFFISLMVTLIIVHPTALRTARMMPQQLKPQ